ncbi:MAG: type I restriction endonuclease, partial [Ktedonobacterales bacterium]
MSPHTFTESIVEDAALDWLAELGYGIRHGQDIAPGEPQAERDSFGEVVLVGRLRAALMRLNSRLPEEVREDALRQTLRVGGPGLVESNRRFHALLTGGVPVEVKRPDGSTAGERAWLIDFDTPERNDWLAINQFTIIEGRANRRPDIVLFVNGLPLAVLELKNAADEHATIAGAWNQFQTYQRDIPSLFVYNAGLVLSDGTEARLGSLTAPFERFMPWRTVDGDTLAPRSVPELETLLHGVFSQRRFLDLLHHFIVFEV